MENEKENKYFIIWLYISILLHLFVVIIMLSIKPTTSPSADPDPASGNYNPTQVLFMQDEPEPVQALDEPQQPEFKIATRVQGGDVSLQHSPAEPKEAELDIPEASLSDDYKKGMVNQTTIEDQAADGAVNIQEDAIIDPTQAQPQLQIVTEPQQLSTPQPEDFAEKNQTEQLDIAPLTELKTFIESQEKRLASAQALKALIQEKMQKTSAPTEDIAQPNIQKIISKKHRPADIGPENSSKVQLSKQTQETISSKKKLSLKDLQQGFSQFLQSGNEQYYSGQGNAQHDDAEGLRRASYYRQLGQMYNNAHAIAPNLLHGSQYDTPSNNSVIMITIDRSGKINNLQMITTTGVDALDRHHMRIIESIGSFPPIPKYIEAPLQITATLHFRSDQSSAGTFMPSRMRR